MTNDDELPVPRIRPQWGERAAVVVPKLAHQREVAMSIEPGSGIVAFQMPGAADRFIVYYEGNLSGASNLATFEDRAMNAYGRMAKSYPTVAMSALKRDLFEVIGHIAPNEFEINRGSAALEAWTAHDPALLVSPVRYPRGPR